MPFQQADGVRYYTFESLSLPGLAHALFTRQGGVSPAPWDALNVGGTLGDDPGRVSENRRRSFAALGRPTESQFDVWQVHGNRVIVADQPRPPDEPYQKADAIITDRSQVTLFMRFADCTPILLYDPVRRAVGLAHAGWKGTLARVAAEAVRRMQAEYGCRPADIRAAIGPSIGAHHYEVGLEVVEQVRRVFGPEAGRLLPASHSAVQFDLWAANRLVLEEAGVSQIEIAGICTACSLQDWYSHRGEKGRTGRFGALIALD